MNTAMTGFLTGFAKGASKKIEKEREDEETLMLNRFKIASANKKVADEERSAEEKILQERLGFVNTYTPQATDQQKIALLSNPFLVSQLQDKIKSNQIDTIDVDGKSVVDLDKYLYINKDKIPTEFTTVKAYMDSLQDKTTGEYVPLQSRSVMGANVSPSTTKMQSMAAGLGGTVDELLSYENRKPKQPREMFGSIVAGSLKKDQTIDQRFETAAQEALDAQQQFGEDSPESKAANENFNVIKDFKDSLDPKEATWASYISNLKLAIVKSKDPNEQSQLRAKLNREQKMVGDDKGADGKVPTASVMSNLLRNAASNAVEIMFGARVKDQLVFTTNDVGITTFKYIGTDEKIQKDIREEGRRAMSRALSPYLDNGVPVNDDVRLAMSVHQYKFDGTGRVSEQSEEPVPVPVPVPPPKAKIPEITTKEEYDALPSGATYIDTTDNNKTKRKS